MEIARFVPADLEELNGSTLHEASTLTQFESWTARRDGRVVACAGIIPLWNGRFQAWSVIAQDIGPSGMVSLTRTIRRFLDMQQGRIEAYVLDGFPQGKRWAEMLGFARETDVMRRFMPSGADAVLYARVR